MNWYHKVLLRYAEINGRARRSEYWCFVLINIIISIVIYLVDTGIGLFGDLGIIYSLGILIPSIAIGVRRLHDIGRSGWYLLLAFILINGAVTLLPFFFQS